MANLIIMHRVTHRIILLAMMLLLPGGLLMCQMDYYNKIFTHQKDSLVKELNNYPAADTARANALYNILDYAVFLSQKKEVLPYWEEALALSRKLHFKKIEVSCLAWRGVYYKSAKNNDSAIIFLDSAIQLAGNSPDLVQKGLRGYAFFEKGLLYENKENYYTALSYYFDALKSYDGSDLRKQKSISLRIADIYNKMHNDDKALEYYQAALKFYEEEKGSNANNEAEGIYTNIAGMYFNRGDLPKASFYLNKLKPSMPDTAETILTGGYYRLAGEIASKENKTDSAIFYLKEALQYYDYTNEIHLDLIANVYTDIGRLTIKSGNINEAKAYFEKGLDAANQSSQKEIISYALTGMAEYYDKMGNPSAAYQSLQQANLLNDSVITEANINQANTLAAIYENDKKQKEIFQLQADKKIQAAIVKQKSLLITIFIITLMALLITGILLYRNFRHKQMLAFQQHQIQQQKITELEKEKQLLSVEAMLKGQEEERGRIAKDLHDGLGGMLSGVKISFSNMKENMIMDAANTAAFEKSIAQLDNTIAELRKVAHNLMPEALVKFGLKSAVKDFCGSMHLTGNTKIICEQLGDERELGNIADVNVYRIIQELVNNAIIHGMASQILVQVTKSNDKVLITVEDNGKGFNLNTLKKSTGIGLSNIKHRVNYFNGKIDMDSKPDEGTSVNIELIA
ncbi:MAG: ATP-binding protein [Ferruginibacter sp.]